MNSTQAQVTVPLLDLKGQYDPIENEVFEAFKEVYQSKQFILGPKVEALEIALASYCQTRRTVGVSSGTDALVLALMALNIGPGDEVITTPFTFFATAGSIARVGATPVFVDIDPDTFNINVNLIEAKITPKTKAIMPVYLFGQMANMEPLMALSKKYNLAVIEDACQAIGAEYTDSAGRTYKAGSMGDVGCFSFFPSKNLGCIGDGGLVSANDEALADKMVSLRNHGAKERYFHDFVGGNFRLDAIQAAVLLVKLPHLEEQHQMRIKNAQFYNAHLKNSKVRLPVVKPENGMIYNQYTLRTTQREALQAHLTQRNIGSAIYYPVPLHLQACFSYLGHKVGDFPEAEKASKEVLSIPIYAELSPAQLQAVSDAINSF